MQPFAAVFDIVDVERRDPQAPWSMMMIRSVAAALLLLSVKRVARFRTGWPASARRQAIDNAGKNIRYRVESEVARGQANAQSENCWAASCAELSGTSDLWVPRCNMKFGPAERWFCGSVLNDAAKSKAVELIENTIGVTSVVDELAVVKAVKVIEAKPATQVIEVTPPVGPETKVIIKP